MNLDEAYKMIMNSEDLQKKFVEAAKENKLETFLKEQNIDATFDEVKEYLAKKFTNENGELSKEELDLIAGGDKQIAGIFGFSILTLGIGCLVSASIEKANIKSKCGF